MHYAFVPSRLDYCSALFLLDFPQKSSLLCSFSRILLQGYANMLDTECSTESLP